MSPRFRKSVTIASAVVVCLLPGIPFTAGLMDLATGAVRSDPMLHKITAICGALYFGLLLFVVWRPMGKEGQNMVIMVALIGQALSAFMALSYRDKQGVALSVPLLLSLVFVGWYFFLRESLRKVQEEAEGRR